MELAFMRVESDVKGIVESDKLQYYYCWWLKSCTTKDDGYPIIYLF